MSDIIAVVNAVLTLLLAAYAIFHNDIRSCITRPKLEISVLPDRDCMMLGWGGKGIDTILVFYLRLFVENNGKRKAENAQIRVTRIETRQSDGKYTKRDEFPTMNLIWSTQKTLQSIQPKSDEYCNLAHIFNPSDRHSRKMRKSEPLEDRSWDNVDRNLTVLSVDVNQLYSKPHLLPPGSHRFYLKLTADGTKPQIKMIEVSLSGKWYNDPDAMREHGATMRLLKASSTLDTYC